MRTLDKSVAVLCVLTAAILPAALAAEAIPAEAQAALKTLADPETPDSGPRSRWTARVKVERHGPGMLPALLELLRTDTKHVTVRLNAVIAITHIVAAAPASAPAVINDLPGLLTAPEFPVRYWAVKLAGAAGRPESISKLLEMLNASGEPSLSQEIVAALAQIGDNRALKPLGALMLNDEADGGVRASAADALKTMNDPAAINSLLKVMQSKDPRTANDPRIMFAATSALSALSGCTISTTAGDTPDKIKLNLEQWQECWEAKQK